MATRRSAPRWRPVMVAIVLAVASTAVHADEDGPRRIVSANLCADRLVLQLVDRDRVVSVSNFAADPAVSTVATQAAGIPANEGGVEEIVALHPDLVVSGAFNSLTTGRMLRSLGIKVHQLAPADSFADVRSVIRALAAALSVPERGEQVIAEMDGRLAALAKPARPVKAAVYQAGGWSSGRGTMADALFQTLGYTNIAAQSGVVGFGALPLESLVASSPDLIVVESAGEKEPSIAGDLLRHPALAHGGARRVDVPMRLWTCPDPALADAAALIAGAMQ